MIPIGLAIGYLPWRSARIAGRIVFTIIVLLQFLVEIAHAPHPMHFLSNTIFGTLAVVGALYALAAVNKGIDQGRIWAWAVAIAMIVAGAIDAFSDANAQDLLTPCPALRAGRKNLRQAREVSASPRLPR
jgi:hypothetical protein